MTDLDFRPDEEFAAAAADWADDAVTFAREKFRLELDYSDDSVERLERMAAAIHKERPRRPADPQAYERRLGEFAAILGSYVGEVFRRNHAGRWGKAIASTGEEAWAMEDPARGTFYPIQKALLRLENGAEDNLWHYFLLLAYPDGGHPRMQRLEFDANGHIRTSEKPRRFRLPWSR